MSFINEVGRVSNARIDGPTPHHRGQPANLESNTHDSDQHTDERSTDPNTALRKFRFDRSLRVSLLSRNAVIDVRTGNCIERGTECKVTFDSADAP